LRPLGLWRPSTRAWRQDDAGSRPPCIGVSGAARARPHLTRVADPRRRARADLQRYLDAFLHDTSDRLPQIGAPTLVLAGGRDSTARPPLCQAVAELIPGALFEVMEEEAHQPFQEVPDEWNARVDAFWRQVEARG
jgi:pimeloyl-ACP methyl ester carboxylesterase